MGRPKLVYQRLKDGYAVKDGSHDVAVYEDPEHLEDSGIWLVDITLFDGRLRLAAVATSTTREGAERNARAQIRRFWWEG